MSATITLPETGTWALDPTHTAIEITARHMMITKVRGSFKAFEGAIEIGDGPENSSVEVKIDASSIDTGVEDRNNHLRSPDFLDIESYGTITFASTSVTPDGDGYRLTGDLTIKDVTNPIELDMTFRGLATDPWGNDKASFSARGTFDRNQWDLGWNVALEAGGWLVSKTFDIEIEAQAAKA